MFEGCPSLEGRFKHSNPYYRYHWTEMATSTPSNDLFVPETQVLSFVPQVARDWVPETAKHIARVLHLINGEHFSGAERVQQLLGKRLPEQGVDAEFVCLKPGKFPSLCELPDEKIHLAPMKHRLDWKAIQQVEELVYERGIDLLHAHTPRTALIAGFVAARCKLPWIYHVHSPAARDSTRPWINSINDWLERWSLRNCTKIITVSRSLRREMLRRGWDRSKLVAIPNGVACQTPIDAQTRIDNKTWRLGIVALFRPRKGIEVLLQALASSKTSAQIELEVIGGFETEEYQAQVIKLVEQLGLSSRVHMRGFVKDIPNAMRNLDAMVLPSLFGEGMPMVVLEALAVGVPVIATKVEGTPEVVRDGVEGVLANPQDPESLALAIERFTSSREEWVAMSDRAFSRHRDHYSDLRMAENTARVYRKLMVSKR